MKKNIALSLALITSPALFTVPNNTPSDLQAERDAAALRIDEYWKKQFEAWKILRSTIDSFNTRNVAWNLERTLLIGKLIEQHDELLMLIGRQLPEIRKMLQMPESTTQDQATNGAQPNRIGSIWDATLKKECDIE